MRVNICMKVVRILTEEKEVYTINANLPKLCIVKISTSIRNTMFVVNPSCRKVILYKANS